MVDCLLSMYGFFPKEVYDGDKVYRHVRRTAFKKIADIPLLLNYMDRRTGSGARMSIPESGEQSESNRVASQVSESESS